MKKIITIIIIVLCCWLPIKASELLVPSQYPTIQAAINDANNGDIVIVSAGRYYENIDFKGRNITLTSKDPNDSQIVDSTIIDGNRPADINNGSVVTFKSGETRNAIIKGFTITGGIGTKNGDIYYGGGIYCSGASPTILQNVIINNTALGNSSMGGGFYGRNGSNILLKGNKIIDNFAHTAGGIYALLSIEIYNNIICHNIAESSGGGIYSRSQAVIANNIIYDNMAELGNGGGIYLRGVGNSIVKGNTIFGNASGQDGANLDIQFSNNVIVANNIITDAINGPGVYLYQTTMDFRYNNLWNNFGGNYEGISDQTGLNGNVSINPLFVNPDNNDFHLQAISPCINTGDPTFIGDLNEVDIDGQARILLGQVDIGSDEYSGNIGPVANAGPDQLMSSIPQLITLDGSGSADPENDGLKYHWRQINVKGPKVDLINPKSVNPSFVPSDLGIYVFELVVNDGLTDSLPDTVGIVIGNKPPVANAGPDRYSEATIVLDGTTSYDPEGYGVLTYHWEQISGPAADINDPNTAYPVIHFNYTNEIELCEFALTVSDGQLTSKPDVVCVTIVPFFSIYKTIILLNPPFDPNKPTILAFGGGNCSSGGPIYLDSGDNEWIQKVNWLTPTSYLPPYSRYGDILIVYLSEHAPYYGQPIQTIGFSTGNMPAIDVANYINLTYQDPRYTVNRVTLLDPACRDYSDSIKTFINSAVDGQQCWIDTYFSQLGRYYSGALNIKFPRPPHDHYSPVMWYDESLNLGSYIWETDPYNNGLVAGGYLSVAGPGKNLQINNTSKYCFQWTGGYNPSRYQLYPGQLVFYNQSLYPGRLPQPVILSGPADGNTVDSNGAVLSCLVSKNAVGYQVLLGPDPYNMDYLISDSVNLPAEMVSIFPFKETWWTVKARDRYGSTIYANPICIKPEKVSPPIYNADDGQYLACTSYEMVSHKKLSQRVFEYSFRMKIKNMSLQDTNSIIVELKSSPPNVTILNSKLFFSSIPVRQEVLSEDTFSVRIDGGSPADINDLIWEMTYQMEWDFNFDCIVNFKDFAILAQFWMYSNCNEPDWCNGADMDRNNIVDSIDLCNFSEYWLTRKADYMLTTSVTGGHGSILPSSDYRGRNEIVSLIATPDANYVVKSWYGTDDDSSKNMVNTVTMTSAKSVSVEFGFLYSLTTSVVGDHGTIQPISGSHVEGSVVQLIATPDPNYGVKAWNGTDNDSSQSTINSATMNSSKTVTVEFGPLYNLSASVIGGRGQIVTQPFLNSYVEGTVVTLIAIPDVGCAVKAWHGTDDDNSTGTVNTVTMNSSKAVTVEFVVLHNLSAEVVGGHGTIQPNYNNYPEGTVVTLTAIPEAGYFVKAWQGTDDDNSTSVTNTVTMNTGKYITVEFKPVFLNCGFEMGDLAYWTPSATTSGSYVEILEYTLTEGKYCVELCVWDETSVSLSRTIELSAGMNCIFSFDYECYESGGHSYVKINGTDYELTAGGINHFSMPLSSSFTIEFHQDGNGYLDIDNCTLQQQ